MALDLFSAAAGGWSLGLHRAGFRTLAACEAVDWRRALYAENNPGIPIYDDVRTLTAARLVSDLGRLPDIIVGSPPCQDISSANTKGKGVEGERSGLYFEAVRIIGDCRPRWFALENSSNLRTRGADAVIAALEAIGYTCWAFVVRAGDIGANHERPRSWLIGCDLVQVADPDGHGRPEGGGRWWRRLDLSVQDDPCDAEENGRGQGLSRRHSQPAGRPCKPPRGDAGHADRRDEGKVASIFGGAHAEPARNTPDPDQAGQAGQADGCMDGGLRQEEIADDGRGDGRGDDRQGIGQMDLCADDRRATDRSWADWSLNDLAGRLRLDDGLPARLAGTRVAVGGPKGTAAASLIVEAYGDAVVPQIPEAIGRAILRVEAALLTVLEAAA